jgi:tetratricopeptide (TPR) repeat protein
MKFNRRSSVVLVVGLCAIGSAWWYRQDTLTRRLAARPPAQQTIQQTVPANASPSQTQTATLRMQATHLEARVAARPDDVLARQALVLTYQQLGQGDQAMAQLETILRLQPKSPNAYLALANARLASKQWPQAEQTYRAMTLHWPKEYVGWQGLAAAQYHQGHFQEAAMAAQKAQTLQPDSPSNRFILASSLLEYAMQYPQPQLHSSALEWARKEFEKLTQVWPNTGDIYLRLGRICIATRDFTAAATYLEKAAQLLPKRADVPLFLSKAYASSRNIPAARRVLEQGVAHHPESADLCDALGQLVQSSGEPNADQQSLMLFQKAVQFAPRNGRFQERLGAASLRANHLDEARQAFETAVHLNPNRAFPVQQLASVYARLHDPKRAATAAKQSEILNFNAQQLSHLEALVNTHQEDVSLHKTLADRYRFIGDKGAARNEYLALLRLDPQNLHAQQSLADIDRSPTGTTTASMPPLP